MKCPPCSNVPIRSQVAKAPAYTNSQRCWDGEKYFLSSVMFDRGSSDLSCSPEGFLLSYHLVTAPFFAKDATRMSPIGFFFFLSHFALEKFLQVQRFFSLFWMMFFQSQSRKEDWKRSRQNEDVSTAAVGRGENQGQWKTDEQKSSKGSAMVSRCTDSKG